jgi:hypothetical protein
MSVGVAAALITRQKIRSRIFMVVTALAMMTNVGIIAAIVAVITRSAHAVGGVLVFAIIAVIIGATEAALAVSEVRVYSRKAAPDDPLLPMVTKIAKQLDIEPPTVWIIEVDSAVNAFSSGHGDDAEIFYTRSFVEEFGDDLLIEAVTTYLLGRVATEDNLVTVMATGLMDWALMLFAVILLLCGALWDAATACWNFKGLVKPTPTGNPGEDIVNGPLYWMAQAAILLASSLALMTGAVALFVFGGSLTALAGGVWFVVRQQQKRAAKDITTSVFGNEDAMEDTLAGFGHFTKADVEINCMKPSIQPLRFTAAAAVSLQEPYLDSAERPAIA